MIVAAVIIGAFLFTFLADLLYKRLWSNNLEVKIKFKEEAVTEGMDSVLTETIINRKWMFLPLLQVGFQTHKNLQFSVGENVSVSDLSYKRDIFSVGSYQKITREIPFHCSKRGFYEIEKTEMLTRSPSMTKKYYRIDDQGKCIYVYPKLMANRMFDVSFEKIMGTVEMQKRIYEDPFEFRGIREYQPADPMSRINWKASAKSEQWMVNSYGSTSAQEIIIFLDLEDETVWKYDDIHEEQIRLAASLAARFCDEGIPVGLKTNGKDLKLDEILELMPGTGKQQMENINRGLARIDLSKTPVPMEQIVDNERKNLEHLQRTYLMISKNQRKESFESFTNLLKEGASGYWISMRYEEMEWKLPVDGSIPVIHWEVQR